MDTPPTKAKLIWQCRRGMLELDLILSRFIEKALDKLTAQQITTFETLLHATDPELYAWFMGHDCPNDKELAELVALIRLHGTP